MWEILKGRAILKVAPGLAKEPKGQGLFLIMLVVMASLGATFAGYYVDTTLIHKPLDVFGICAAPATLGPVGGIAYGVGATVQCYTVTEKTQLVNGQPSIVDVQVPAGSYEYINNGSAYHP